MVTLLSPGAGEDIRATHITQFVNVLTGASGGGARVNLTDVSDSASYAVTVGNQDTTNGYALKVQAGPIAKPTTLATFAAGGSRVQSANGTHYLNVDSTGVAIVGAFSLNGNAIGSGIRAFNVLDYGIATSTDAIEASAGTAIRAVNDAAFDTLMTALRAAGGGDIEYPPHTANRFYPFTAPLTLDHSTQAGISLTLRGHGQSSVLKLYGVSGAANGIDFAGAGTSLWRRSAVRDLVLYVDSALTTPTGGAALVLRKVDGFEVENVWIREAYTGIQVGVSETGITNIPIHVRIRGVDCDLYSGSNGAGLAITPAAGIWVESSTFDGNAGNTGSFGLRVLPVGGSIDPTTYNSVDSLWIDNCNFNGHKTGLRFGEAGTLSNVFISKTHFDGNGIGASASTALHIETAGGAVVENVQMSDPWVAVYASSVGYGLLANDSTGRISNLTVRGGYFTSGSPGGAKSAAISLQGSPENVILEGNIVNGGTATNNNEIDVQGGNGIIVSGNRVTGPASSGYAIFVATTVANIVTVGNVGTGKLTGGTVYGGTTSSTRILANNI